MVFVGINPHVGVSVKPLAKPAAEASHQDPIYVLVKNDTKDPCSETLESAALAAATSADQYEPFFLSEESNGQGANLEALARIRKKRSPLNISSF